MSPERAREMHDETKAFLHMVRRWSGEVPISNRAYLALDVLNFALNLAMSQFNAEGGSNAPDPFLLRRRSEVDAGEE